MKKYEVTKPFWKGGRRYIVGDPIQLTDPEARNLARAGTIEAVAPAKPKAQGQKPKAATEKGAK